MRISSASRAVRAHNPTIATTSILDRTELLLLVGVLIIAFLLRLPGFALPFERDEGAYAYVAWNWLHGGLPYRDAFDHKPPLIYLLYLPMFLAGTPTAFALRLWSTLLFLIDVGLVYAIGRRVWQRRAALLAAFIFGVAGSAFDLQGLVLNTDQALVLPALIGLWCAIRLHETGRLLFALAAGAAITAAILIKPVAIVLAPMLLIAAPRSTQQVIKICLVAMLGASLIAAPIALYFALRGGWHEFVFGVLTYNRLYAQEAQERWQLGTLVDMFAPFVPLLLVALGGVALLGRSDADAAPINRRGGWLIVAWSVALLLAALGSLRPFVHYYYPILPFLALLAAPCVTWLWSKEHATTRVQRMAGRIAPMLLATLLIAPYGWQNLRLIGATAEQQAERLYGDVGKHYFAQAPLVAKYVRQRTQPGDPIYIFAAEPEVYVLAQRRSSSRYIYDYPLYLMPGASAELQRDLAANQPKLVITYYGVRPDGFFQTLRANNYEKLGEIGGYEIFGAK